MSTSGIFKQPFQEQAAFFRNKLNNQVPTESWTDIQKSQHDTAFMVAGAQKADLLSDLAAAVDKAIVQGTGLEEFRKDFKDTVARHGWDYRGGFNWRTKVIYQTNLSTSYAAGRWAQLTNGDFSHIVYKHSKAVEHPRLQHLAWDGLTLPIEDQFWNTHAPPNGWGCQCRLVGVRRPEDATRFGGDPERSAPEVKINPITKAPEGIDKGWNYAPGKTVSHTLRAIVDKISNLPAPLGADLANSPVVKAHARIHYEEWLKLARIGEHPSPVFVGTMSRQDIQDLNANNIDPKSSEIFLREGLLHGPKAKRHAKKGDDLKDIWDELPDLIENPIAVAYDPKSKHLVYYLAGDGSRTPQLAIEVGYSVGRTKTEVNMIVSAYQPKTLDLEARIKGKQLILLRGRLK